MRTRTCRAKAPKTPAVLDQKACMYEPHVLAMMAGQGVVVKNSDPFLHNVHSQSTTNDVFKYRNAECKPRVKVDPQPKAPETFRVKCDVHPWMSAWIAVFDHPYFSVTGDDELSTSKICPMAPTRCRHGMNCTARRSRRSP